MMVILLRNRFCCGQLWSSVSPLTFTRSDAIEVDLEISFEVRKHGDDSPFDGPGRLLGHAFLPQNSDIHLDDDEPWLDYRSMGPYGTHKGQFVLWHIGANTSASGRNFPLFVFDPGFLLSAESGFNISIYFFSCDKLWLDSQDRRD